MIAPYSVHFPLRGSLRSVCRLVMIGALSGCLVLSACKEKSAEPQDNVGLTESTPPTSTEIYQDAIAKSDFALARSILDRDGESVSTSVEVPLNDLYRDLGRRLANSDQIDLALSLFNSRAAAGDALAMIWRDGLAAKKADEPSRSEYLTVQMNGITADLSSKSWDRLAARLGVLDLLTPFEEDLELLIARSSIELAQSGAQLPIDAVDSLDDANRRLIILAENGNAAAASVIEAIPAAKVAVRQNLFYLRALSFYTDEKYLKAADLLRQGRERLPQDSGVDQLYGQSLFSHGSNAELDLETKSAFFEEAREVFSTLDPVEVPAALIWLDVIQQAILRELTAPTLEEGRKLFVDADYEAAIPVFERALDLDPNSVQSKHFLSQSLVLYARAGSGPTASAALDRADIILKELAETGADVDVYQSIARTQRERLALAPILIPAQEAYDAEQYAEAISMLEDARKTRQSSLIEQLYVQSLILRAAQPDIARASARALFDRAERLLRSRPDPEDALTQGWLNILTDSRTTFEMNIELDEVKALYANQNYTQTLELLEVLEQKYPNNTVLLGWRRVALIGEGSESSLREVFRILDEANRTYIGSADDWTGQVTRVARPFISERWFAELYGRDFSPNLMKKIGEELLAETGLAKDQILGYRLIFRAAHTEGWPAPEMIQSVGGAVNHDAACNIALAVYRAEARELKRLGADVADPPLCPPDGSASQVEGVLKSAYQIVIDVADLGGLMDLFDPSIDRANRDGVRLVPPQFDKPFSIVSDADSQTVGELTTQTGYMQDVLGLPVPSSIFVETDIDFGGTAVSNRSATLSNSNKSQNGSMIDGPAAFSVARDWHTGRADHLHGWSSARVVAQHYFANPRSLIKQETIDLTPLFESSTNSPDVIAPYLGANYLTMWGRSHHSVLRLFLGGALPRDAQVRVANGERWVAYDVNGLRSASAGITENGKPVTVVELPIHPGNGSLIAKDDGQDALGNFALHVRSDACADETGQSCDVLLLGLDFDTQGRASIERTGEWVQAFGLSPVLYTAHGGDRVSSMGVVNQSDSQLGQTHISYGKPLAAQPDSKAYIADVLSDIGIRGVRPFSSTRTSQVMKSFPLPSETFREFGNFTIFQTQWISGSAPNGELFPDVADLQVETLRGLTDLGECNLALEGYLPAYIETSLRSDLSKDPTGEVWYTHLSPKCPNAPPLSDTIGFSKMTHDSLVSLARRSYGLSTQEEIETFPNRLWVVPPSAIFRTRILQQELSIGGLDIEMGEGDVTQVSSKPSLYYGDERFPREGFLTQDLNGLTLEMTEDKLAAFTLRVDDAMLPAIVKTKIETNSSVKGYATILDLTEATPMADPLDMSSPNAVFSGDELSVAKGNVCLKADHGTPLHNVSAIGFSMNSRRDANELALEFVFKDSPGSVVFAAEGANYSYRNGPNTIYNFDAGLATPNDGGWRYLLPTWDISDVQGDRTNAMPPIMAGELREICIHSKTAVKFAGFRAYHYASQNRRPGDPLKVGGRIAGGNQGDLVTITPFGQAPVYSTPDADGQWYATVSGGEKSPYDEAAGPIKLLIAAEQLTDAGSARVVDTRDVTLQRSRLDLDLGDRP